MIITAGVVRRPARARNHTAVSMEAGPPLPLPTHGPPVREWAPATRDELLPCDGTCAGDVRVTDAVLLSRARVVLMPAPVQVADVAAGLAEDPVLPGLRRRVLCVPCARAALLRLFPGSIQRVPRTFDDAWAAMRQRPRPAAVYGVEQAIPRSRYLLEEMTTLVQNGDTIAASGRNKDDRIFAACLATYAWDMWRRVPMLSENRTYEREMAEQNRIESTNQDHVMGHIIPDFFKQQATNRRQAYLNSLDD